METIAKRKIRFGWAVMAVLVFLEAIYVLGGVLLQQTRLELREWVDVAGKLLTWALPVIVTVSALRWLKGKTGACRLGRAFSAFLRFAAAVIGLLWSFWMLLLLVFTTESEYRVMPGLLYVDKGNFLEGTEFMPYEPVALFFRRSSAGATMEMKLAWLERKYKRKFEISESGLFEDTERPGVRAEVVVAGKDVVDNYLNNLTCYYLDTGSRELGLTRAHWNTDIRYNSAGFWYGGWQPVLEGEEDIEAFCLDVSRLLEYVAKADTIYQKQRAVLYFSIRKYGYENPNNISTLPFGKLGRWDHMKSDYYLNQEELQAIVRKRLETASEWAAQEEIEEELTYAAKILYAELLEEDGYTYEQKYNAKGNLYIDLGRHAADRLQNEEMTSDYYLTYDRESKNGRCWLFVLSERPVTENDAKADERLLEFYAVEKETGQIAVGSKTAWNQLGSAEYRELTGE